MIERLHIPARSLAPDLARGLMLLLISWANVSWFLWGRPTTGGPHLVAGTDLDKAVRFLMQVMVDGRAFPLYAFLFGYGMVQFHRSRVACGIPEPDVRHMLWRRHWAMVLVFGLPHAALLFVGDILATYGLAGLALTWLFFRRRDRTVAVWIIVMLAFMTVMSILSLISGIIVLQQPAPEQSENFMDLARTMMYGNGDGYLVSIVWRLVGWAMTTLTSLFTLVIPAWVMLGWLAARRGVLDDPASHRSLLIKAAAILIPIGWLGGLPSALMSIGAIPIPVENSWMFQSLDQLTGLFGGLGYAALFGLLGLMWQATQPTLVRAIAAVGKRSLTFYLLQSLIHAPLFASWGLGLGGEMNTAGAIGIATLTWIASVGIAWLLEARGVRGPAELLLRRITYGTAKTAPSAPSGATA